MARSADLWLEKMRQRPTLECDGPWLLKFQASDTQVWINEINKKRCAKRRRKIKNKWVDESYLIRDRGWVNNDKFHEPER